MRIYDISVGVSPGLPVWPGDRPVRLERVKSIEKGSHDNVSELSCGVHVGTHVDAPLHFIRDGAPVEKLSLKVLTGRAYVVDMGKAAVLDASALEAASIPSRTRRILFKTRNSSFWARQLPDFQTDFVAIDASGAEWLVRRGVQLVGVDYLSVAPYKKSLETHRTLLGAGVVVVEGLNLTGVSQGRYTLYCLPIKLVGSDGAPARAILVGV
jgi:arylformamidase